MTEARWRGSDWPGARPLRCQVCGRTVGVVYGDTPDPGAASVECYECAVVCEARRVLDTEAGDD